MKHSGDEWKEWTAIGVCFLLIALGIGGCQYLVKRSDVEIINYQQKADE